MTKKAFVLGVFLLSINGLNAQKDEAYREIPNTFTFSPPAEAEWLGWFAARENLDGYLRWTLNSWVKNPLQDSRFTAWAGGDIYLVYPGGRSSIRFERLIEGIQAYEKSKY